MTIMLPTGRGIPVPVGSTSEPCPGAQPESHDDDPRSAIVPTPPMPGPPKHVQPLPPSLSLVAAAACDGGTQ